MNLDPRLIELLERAEELREQGQAIVPAELCADCPELLEELKRHVRVLQGVNSLLETSKRPAMPAGSRYEITAFLAAGGMGTVWRGFDNQLQREVAIKTLQEDCPLRGSAARRFVEEAHITGQLQHPGIPPIHEVGKCADGRPFLAMKLIKGRTLAALLHQRGETNFVAVFEAVAQAVGYAHAHGVIHRDLKPANIMVGSFGEVQIMDWGIAKLLAGGPANATDPDDTVGTEIRSLRDDADETEAGVALGTWAYMPPEQAIGATDKVDARSDVFGLGAILCAILAGRPPYVGENAEGTRQLAARAKLDEAFAALDRSQAEPGLVTLCKRCLSAEQALRPADANMVAQEVAGIRADSEERARQAELARAQAAVRNAELRKRWRILTWSVGLICTVLVIAAAVSVRQAVRAINAETKTAEQLVVVGERTRHALDLTEQMVFDIQNKLKDAPGTEELRKSMLENARPGLRKILDDARKQGRPDHILVWSHLQMGDLELGVGNTSAAETEYRAGHEWAQQLVDANPTDGDAQRDLRRDLSISFQRLASLARQVGRMQDALEFYEKALTVSQSLVDANPQSAQAQSDLGIILKDLGNLWRQLEDTKKALEFYERQLTICEALVKADPGNRELKRNLSASLHNVADMTWKQRGKPQDAVPLFERGHKIVQELADTSDLQAKRDLGLSFMMVGDLTLELGPAEDALEYYQNCRNVRQKIVDANPRSYQDRRDLGMILVRLGNATLQMGRTQDAVEFYRECLEIRESLAADDPQNLRVHEDVFVSCYKLGAIELSRHDFAKAAEWFSKARSALLPWHEKQLLAGQFKIAIATVDRHLLECADSEKAIEDIEFVFKQKPELIPGLLNDRVRALFYRKQPAEAVATAERFAEWAEKQEQDRNDQRYNAACAFALCAAANEPHRESLVAKVLALLRQAKADGYFDEKRIAHLRQDEDFAGLRNREDFQKLLAELGESAKP